MNTQGSTPWARKLPGKRRALAEPTPHFSMRHVRVGKTIELRDSIGDLKLVGVRAKSTYYAQLAIPRPAWSEPATGPRVERNKVRAEKLRQRRIERRATRLA
jgi:hypothetical protein